MTVRSVLRAKLDGLLIEARGQILPKQRARVVQQNFMCAAAARREESLISHCALEKRDRACIAYVMAAGDSDHLLGGFRFRASQALKRRSPPPLLLLLWSVRQIDDVSCSRRCNCGSSSLWSTPTALVTKQSAMLGAESGGVLRAACKLVNCHSVAVGLAEALSKPSVSECVVVVVIEAVSEPTCQALIVADL